MDKNLASVGHEIYEKQFLVKLLPLEIGRLLQRWMLPITTTL